MKIANSVQNLGSRAYLQLLNQHALKSDLEEAETLNTQTLGRQEEGPEDAVDLKLSERMSKLKAMQKPWKSEESSLKLTEESEEPVEESRGGAQKDKETFERVRAENRKHRLDIQSLNQETNGYIIASHRQSYRKTIKMRSESHKLFLEAFTTS